MKGRSVIIIVLILLAGVTAGLGLTRQFEQTVAAGIVSAGEVKQGLAEVGSRVSMEDLLSPERYFEEDNVTLAFFGLDKNEDRTETMGSFRTDSIMVIRFDFARGEVDLVSIPRDTYCKINNRDFYDKINHAFPFGGGIEGGGFENSVVTVSEFLGATEIDGYFGMDMQVVARVVDAIGGVWYNIDLDSERYGFTPGYQLVDGALAERYVRFRYTRMGDIDRVRRQQQFLLALMKEAGRKVRQQEISLFAGLQIYREISPYTYTDLSSEQLASLSYYLADIDLDTINTYMVDGWFMNKNGISYWRPDLQQVEKVVAEVWQL